MFWSNGRWADEKVQICRYEDPERIMGGLHSGRWIHKFIYVDLPGRVNSYNRQLPRKLAGQSDGCGIGTLYPGMDLKHHRLRSSSLFRISASEQSTRRKNYPIAEKEWMVQRVVCFLPRLFSCSLRNNLLPKSKLKSSGRMGGSLSHFHLLGYQRACMWIRTVASLF